MSDSRDSSASSRTRTSRRLLAVVAVAIAAGTFAFLALGDIGDNLVYYYSPTELMQNRANAEGASVRLGGLVADQSVQQSGQQGDLELRFAVTDGQTVVPVEASAVPPAMFREGIGVVVEGTLRGDGVFETRRLMVKHDNEYRAPEEGREKSMKELLETMQFDTTNT